MRVWVFAFVLVACEFPAPAIIDAVPGVPDAGIPDAEPPGPSLLTTGLCVDPACTALTPEVVAFAPRWPFWSDGATKRRWISLPAGAQIDTSDVDYWRFPVGTRFWKEFVRDGVRVETRYMEKVGAADDAWTFATYVWNADDSDAFQRAAGVVDARGTGHDVPPDSECVQCHGHTPSRVQGFAALQLDWDAPADDFDLDEAVARGWLSTAPVGPAPRWPLPGAAADQQVLGYLHANCGHCHNSDSQLVNRPMARLEVDHLATVEGTRFYASAVGVVGGPPFEGASVIVAPGDPDGSKLITRMQSTDPEHRMPARAGELIDQPGLAALRAWIAALPTD